MNNLSPEDNLILSCTKLFLNSGRPEEVRGILEKEIDWSYLIRKAHSHGVLPLLYQGLNTSPELVPGDVLNRLKKEFHANTGSNLYLTGKLLELLDLFKSNGISAIPYKGPVLSASVYGDVSLRQFTDLDILIHERDFLKSKNLLISHGYRPEIELSSDRETAFLRLQRDFKFFCNGGEGIVELQWRIPPIYFPFSLDTGRFWRSLEPVFIGAKEIETLSPEDLILTLCIHGLCHNWERLEWVCDVARLMTIRKDIDWGRVLDNASGLGAERILLFGLLLANDLLGIALPEKVLHKAEAEATIKLLAAQRCENFFLDVASPIRAWESSFSHIRVWKCFKEKVRYCLGLAFTPNVKDIELLKFPASLFSLYYLMRPMRLAAEYGMGVLSFIFNRINLR